MLVIELTSSLMVQLVTCPIILSYEHFRYWSFLPYIYVIAMTLTMV